MSDLWLVNACRTCAYHHSHYRPDWDFNENQRKQMRAAQLHFPATLQAILLLEKILFLKNKNKPEAWCCLETAGMKASLGLHK